MTNPPDFMLPEFADNPEPRAAMVILLDQSGSMVGEKLAQAQEGLQHFIHDLQTDRLASKRAEVSLIGFGGDTQTHNVFLSPEDLIAPQLGVIGGGTDTARALEEALTLLESRKDSYKRSGLAYYRPWLVLITDGEPTCPASAYAAACDRVRRLEAQGSVVVLGLGVLGADLVRLSQVSARPPLELRDVASFKAFFLWLSTSLKAVSRSRPGDKVTLPPMDWSSI